MQCYFYMISYFHIAYDCYVLYLQKNSSVVDCILNGTDNSVIIQSSFNAADKAANDALNNVSGILYLVIHSVDNYPSIKKFCENFENIFF